MEGLEEAEVEDQDHQDHQDHQEECNHNCNQWLVLPTKEKEKSKNLRSLMDREKAPSLS